MNYSQLQRYIVDYLARDGDDEFAARLPTAIAVAEAQISRRLRVQSLQRAHTIALIGGIDAYELPNDVAEIIAIVQPGPTRELLAQQYVDLRNDWRTAPGGSPAAYSIFGGSVILRPVPVEAASVDVVYYANVPALTEGNPVNQVLTRYPDIYIYATLAETAAPLGRDPNPFSERAELAIERANQESTSSAFGRLVVRNSRRLV